MGVYGGLIIILLYGNPQQDIEEDFLVTNLAQPILTNNGQMILVTEES
jgi:hypothetical protein